MTEHEFTARVQQGSKVQVVVSKDGEEIAALGGKRAERAQAAVLVQWKGEWLVYGLRADAAKAEGEARRIAADGFKVDAAKVVAVA